MEKIDVTQIYLDMIKHPLTSHGFMIQLKTESYYRTLNFCSSDHPNKAYHPSLSIYYSDTSAIATGLKQINQEKAADFFIYPNPAENYITIELLKGDSKKIVELINTNGLLVDRFNMKTTQRRYDLSHLPAGLYFLRVTNQFGSSTKKLMIR